MHYTQHYTYEINDKEPPFQFQFKMQSTSLSLWRLLFVIALACCSVANVAVQAACQSCIFLPAHQHHQRHTTSRAAWGQLVTTVRQSTRLSEWKRLAVHKLSRTATTKPALVVAACGVTAASCFLPMAVARHYSTRRTAPCLLRSDQTEDEATESEDSEAEDADKANEDVSPVSTGMISAIGFYKAVISPLLPPACRFLPTCSQYGVQAIEEFGPTKGSVLIAWRLLRCSPFGGKGIDYPQWPPVDYNFGSWT